MDNMMKCPYCGGRAIINKIQSIGYVIYKCVICSKEIPVEVDRSVITRTDTRPEGIL
jgi:DNA-directed RNA polymerase subunit RPC12/RpoP